MKLKKYFFFSILLITVVLKVSSLAIHQVTHHADSDGHEIACELCEHLVTSQEFDFLVLETTFELKEEILNFQEENHAIVASAAKQEINLHIYSRPPPHSL